VWLFPRTSDSEDVIAARERRNGDREPQSTLQRAFFHALVGGVAAAALVVGVSQLASSRRSTGSDYSGQLGAAVAAPYVVAVGLGAGYLHGWAQRDGWWERVWPAPETAK
jgi:hypothetical protein